MPWWLLVGPKIGECCKCEVPNTIHVGQHTASVHSQARIFDCASVLHGSGARTLETQLLRRTDIRSEISGGQHRLFFLEFLRTSIRRATRPQVLYRQHQLQKRLHGHWYLCIHFSFADRFNVEFAMALPFPYSARYWFDSGYASLFLHPVLCAETSARSVGSGSRVFDVEGDSFFALQACIEFVQMVAIETVMALAFRVYAFIMPVLVLHLHVVAINVLSSFKSRQRRSTRVG